MPDATPLTFAHARLTYRAPSPVPGESYVRLNLTPEGPWRVGGGMNPDVNAARVPYAEFDKLGGLVQGLQGVIELWWAADPDSGDAPDVELYGQWLVDASIASVGVLAGEESPRAIEYRLAFADFRHAFVPPRGGRLMSGPVNPDPAPPGTTPLQNSELAAACLDAMGAGGGAPGSLDAVAPVRKLSWECSHAPTELARILDYCGHVYCPHSQGLGYVARRGVGSLPDIPPGRLMTDVAVPLADRRAQVVVFTSAPVPVTLTYDEDADPPPAWEFVAQDREGKWQRLADLADLGEPQRAVIADFAGVPDEDRERWRGQVYRCIRLDPQRFNPDKVRVLRQAFLADGKTDAIHLKAGVIGVATEVLPQVWRNVSRRLDASSVDEHNVLTMGELVGRHAIFAPQGTAFPKSFQAIPDEELLVTFSVEHYDKDTGKRDFYAAAFSTSQGAVSDLSPAESQSRLAGYRPDTAIYPVQGLRLIRVNGADANAGELADRCRTVARDMAADAAAVRRVVRVQGFIGVEIDGLVSGFSYDVRSGVTEIETNGWTSPAGPASGFERFGAAGGGGGAGGGAGSAGGGRSPAGGPGFAPGPPARPQDVADGTASVAGPTTFLSHPKPTPKPPEMFFVRVAKTGGGDGSKAAAATWTYDLGTLAGKPLKSGVPQERARVVGRVVPGSGYGLAFFDGAELKLWDAGETGRTGSCPT